MRVGPALQPMITSTVNGADAWGSRSSCNREHSSTLLLLIFLHHHYSEIVSNKCRCDNSSFVTIYSLPEPRYEIVDASCCDLRTIDCFPISLLLSNRASFPSYLSATLCAYRVLALLGTRL